MHASHGSTVSGRLPAQTENLAMQSEPRKHGQWSWWYLLFVVQFVGVLWVPVYNRAEPSLMGVPFFYWYQMLWVIISAVFTAIVYLATDD
jgi:FtsH-binding integral membrane protein